MLERYDSPLIDHCWLIARVGRRSQVENFKEMDGEGELRTFFWGRQRRNDEPVPLGDVKPILHTCSVHVHGDGQSKSLGVVVYPSYL
jgi:hypothetical protein